MITNILNKYNLTKKLFSLTDNNFFMYCNENNDSVLDFVDTEKFQDDERLPYFINVWESGLVLGSYILNNKVHFKGKKVLELGCGGGISGICSSISGSITTFSDYETDALSLSEYNCQINNIYNSKYLLLDWRDYTVNETYDYIIGADLLYENRMIIPLFKLICSILDANNDTKVLLSDPNRSYIDDFIKQFEDHKYLVNRIKGNIKDVSIYEIYC